MLPTWMLMLCQIWAVMLYLQAFLPVKQNTPGYSSLMDLPAEPTNKSIVTHDRLLQQNLYKPAVKKVVFVVIDALRTDFVLGDDGIQHFPQLHKLIRSNFAQIVSGRTHTPTVTMPRIKALTSGTIPGFIDIILNFGATKFAEDNFVTQAYLNKKRLVFYGDETWLRLFPDHFVRSDGTTSFFVADFTEVDNNVTRHLEEELKSLEWDVLILHYLGLDHIGHVHGPKSYLIPSKLLEMDWIIHQIHTALQNHDKATGEASLLFVCGDHGMSDAGGHGGSSLNEISVPLIFVHSRPVIDRKLGASSLLLIPQISVAPTLSVLMGLPIPKNNLGLILPEVLWHLDIRSLLYAFYVNGVQLQELSKNSYRESLNDSLFRGALELHRKWLKLNSHVDSNDVIQAYTSAIIHMMTEVESTMVQYDFFSMMISISLLWMIVLCLVLRVNPVDELWPTPLKYVLGFIFTILIRISVCFLSDGSSKMCQNTPKSIIITMVTFTIVTVVTVELALTIRKVCCLAKRSVSLEFMSPFQKFGVVSWFLQSLSLLSSSFIEEEHQTWYFLSATAHVIIVYCIGRQEDGAGNIHSNFLDTADTSYSLTSLKNVNSQKAECEDYQLLAAHTEAKPYSSPTAGSDEPDANANTLMVMIAASALCSRVCRSWNQTGDKWAHLLDVKHWICKPDQKRILSFGIACSLFTVFILRKRKHSILLQILLFLGLVLVYYYHYITGSVLIPLFPVSKITRGLVEAQLVFIITFIILVWPCLIKCFCSASYLRPSFLHSLVTAWLLLNCVLARPHNIILVALFVIHEQIISTILEHSEHDLNVILYLVLGMSSFYQQGNSNSLSRLDVAAGYVGLSEYWFGVVGILMWCSTYAGLGFWILRMMERIVEKNAVSKQRFYHVIERVILLLCLSRGLPLAVIFSLVAFQHQHLFIWSVFTPKLLYEGMLSVFIMIIIIICCLLRL